MFKSKFNFIFRILILFILTGLFLGIYFYQNSLSKKPTVQKNDDFYSSLITIEIADTIQTQTIGLMNRKELCEKCGMLFIFEKEEQQSFWMDNTLISLDMIFMDSGGKIVTIHQNTKPLQRYPTYNSKLPAKYVLEVNAGFSQRNNLAENQVLDIEKLKSKN